MSPNASSPLREAGLRIERQSTVEQVVNALREAILSGALLPNVALRELALASELGVARSTVREALRVLSTESLVQYTVNQGARVADLSMKDIDDAYAAREVIEMAGIEALQSRHEEPAFAELARLVEQLERAVACGATGLALESDRAFHRTIVAATRNEHLISWYARLQDELRLALSLAERESARLGRTKDDHRELLTAICSQSLPQARAALRQHLDVGARELHALRELVLSKQQSGAGRGPSTPTLV